MGKWIYAKRGTTYLRSWIIKSAGDQEIRALCGVADHPHDGHDQGQVAAGTDDPAEPEPRRGGHRHRHPGPPGDRLDVEFVGLDVPQLDLTLKDPMLVELVGVSAGAVPPVGD